MTASHCQPIPIDIVHRVISHIPASKAKTLATCLLLSKECCHLVARKLYRNVHIGADRNLLVDTGLSSNLLDSPGLHKSQEDFLSEEGDIGEGRKEAAGQDEEGVPRTLKGRFLKMMRTLDIHTRFPCQTKVRVLVYADGNETEEDEYSEPAVKRLPSSLTGLELQLEQVRFRLDTKHYLRPSPFDTPLSEPDLQSFQELLLGMIRTRRLVFHGASLNMSSLMTWQIVPSFLNQIQEVAVILTSGSLTGQGNSTYSDMGLYPIYKQLHMGHTGDSGIPLSADITFVLQTPRQSARINIRALLYKDRGTRVDRYHADLDPSERNFVSMIRDLTVHIMDKSKECGKAKLGKVVLVNFGALFDAEMNPPGSTRSEKEDHVRTRVHEAIELYVPSVLDLDDWKERIEVVGIERWWSGDRSREQVLDEEIVAGWKEAKMEL